MGENQPRYLDRRQAAQYLKDRYGPLGVAPQTLSKMAVRGDGPVFAKFGKRVGYTREALDAWAAGRTVIKSSTSDEGTAAPAVR